MKAFKVNALLFTFSLFNILFLFSTTLAATDNKAESTVSKKKDKLKLETLKIQGNKELPKGLYIVPWQDIKKTKGSKNKQRLVLHSLYGDLFDPVNPNNYLNKEK